MTPAPEWAGTVVPAPETFVVPLQIVVGHRAGEPGGSSSFVKALVDVMADTGSISSVVVNDPGGDDATRRFPVDVYVTAGGARRAAELAVAAFSTARRAVALPDGLTGVYATGAVSAVAPADARPRTQFARSVVPELPQPVRRAATRWSPTAGRLPA